LAGAQGGMARSELGITTFYDNKKIDDMNKAIKPTDHPLFEAFIGDRGLRMYSKAVDARLGMPGLTKLVVEKTGAKPSLDEAYVFLIRNQEAVKILTKDPISTNLLEFYDGSAEKMKAAFVELGLL